MILSGTKQSKAGHGTFYKTVGLVFFNTSLGLTGKRKKEKEKMEKEKDLLCIKRYLRDKIT